MTHIHTVIPLILSECQRKMDAWGSERILDPCSSLHEVRGSEFNLG